MECHQTASFIVDRFKEFGITDIWTGIATSWVITLIEGVQDGFTIALRTDIDSLPLTETIGAPEASEIQNLMHACGHNGHVTLLLGVAKYLAATRNFARRVTVIF